MSYNPLLKSTAGSHHHITGCRCRSTRKLFTGPVEALEVVISLFDAFVF